MKKVLITGKGSYIGENLKKCLEKYSENYMVDVVSTRNEEYKNADFSKYDTVVNVAGIAHIKITSEMEDLFYKVNRDMAIDICKKAKECGVKQFIYLSSMNVYGDTSEEIKGRNQEKPNNFYGKSKLEADLEIHKISEEKFKVVSIRPPVVYGPKCKGNFVKLIKLSKISPIYPTIQNKRSMIYIENLCEYIRWIIDYELEGYFHPQNTAYISTGECMRIIRETLGKRAVGISIFNPVIRWLIKKNHTIERAFSDDFYSMELSWEKCEEAKKYYINDFRKTIEKTLKE